MRGRVRPRFVVGRRTARFLPGVPVSVPPNRVVQAECLDLLRTLPDGSADLIYVDPPFNTGRTQRHTRTAVVRDAAGDRTGFGGRRYRTASLSSLSYADAYDDYLAFLAPRLEQARRVLTAAGTLYVHLDQREVHYVKVLLDGIFGRECFLNEIVWAYDYGGRSRRRWPAKHDTVLVYVRDPKDYFFSQDEVPRIPYLAPKLVGKEKATRGKFPTDVWWHTIVPTSGPERTGYPTQKPLGVVRRIVQASSRPGDLVLDFFAGSGTAGVAALQCGRRFLLVDENPEAIAVMRTRLADADVSWESL